MRLELGDGVDLEFDNDGDLFDITVINHPTFYISLSFKPVHVRAMIKYMTEILSRIEASERVGQDCDLMNANKFNIDRAHKKQ